MKKELSKEELETLLHCLQYVMDYNREQEYPVPQKFKTLELKLKNLLMIEKRSLKMKIENLSQLKKYLTVGVKLRIEYAQPEQFARKTTNGSVRAIKKVQSNAIQFENGSWLYWEKSSRYEFFEGGFSVYWDDEKQNKIMDYYYE